MKYLIVDGHEDIAFNMLAAGRDYRQSVHATRAREAASASSARLREHLGISMLGLPQWLDGGVAVIFATIFTEPARSKFGGDLGARYETAEEAHAIGLQQLQVYRSVTGDGPFQLIRDLGDLDAVLSTWSGDTTSGWVLPGGPVRAAVSGQSPGVSSQHALAPARAGATDGSLGDSVDAPRHAAASRDRRKIGLVLLMENADPIRSPDELDAWYDAGLRVIGPAWMSSRYCGGTFEPGPLTEAGRRLLDAMDRRRMVLDLSHMAEEAFFEAVDRYHGPVIASHSNPRRFADGDRHLTDDMIRAIVLKDGVVGQVPFNAFLLQRWRRSAGDPKNAADLGTVVRTIDYICDLAGSARHVAFGSDFDGGFGAEATPEGIDTVADLQAVIGALADRGYSQADLSAIAHGNWLRTLGRGLPQKTSGQASQVA